MKAILFNIFSCAGLLGIITADNSVVYNLTSDIDCILTPFLAIGNQNQKFEGKIFGNGFTIRNINLVSSLQYVGKE